MIRVLFVEDDPGYRRSVEMLLNYSPGFEIAASFGQVRPALEWASHGQWDLALFDLQLPDGCGIDAIQHLKAIAPQRPAVALTVFEEPATIVRAICAGADGYLLKRSSAPELLRLLRSTLEEGAPLTSSVARKVLEAFRKLAPAPTPAPAPDRLDLTQREQDVLRALVDGLAYKEAAAKLGVSIDSIRTHVRAIYRKLQVHNVASAVSRALRDGLV